VKGSLFLAASFKPILMLRQSFRLLFVTVLAVGASACARQTTTYSSSETSGINPNENREEKTKAGETILIGPTTRIAYEKEPYSTWFHPAYLRYQPNAKIMEELQPLLQGVSIKGFTGSWCMDSQRELPRLYKIMDQARLPYSRLEIVSLREDKTGLGGEEKTANITAVPTFILYRNGQEVGRIVETAYPTLEMNMLTILKAATKK
jgi:thiol-disulfide isomerase/thioredoxin